MTDRQGKEIRVGSRVAYNLSGMVALGTVVAIRDGVLNAGTSYFPRWQNHPIISVGADKPFVKYASKGGVSKLKIWGTDGIVDKLVVLDD